MTTQDPAFAGQFATRDPEWEAKCAELQRKRNTDLVNSRRIVGGPKSDLMQISPMKHAFCREYWNQMLANTWQANEIDISKDVHCYQNELTPGERQAYDGALAFLSNLDGIQLHNITDNIAKHVTSPEVTMVLTRQAFEEALHVDAYSTMIEAISVDPMAVYMMFERDGMLAAKNEYILQQSRELGENYSTEGFCLATVANVVLEGIYFYSGFLVFYALGKRNRMVNSADEIKLINRDEVTHLSFFTRIFQELKVENPEVFTPEFYKKAEAIFRSAVELEIKWGQYLIRGGVLGLSDQIVSDYIKHLANQRWTALTGFAELYPGVRNPCEWVTAFASVNGEEANFFETKVKAYQTGSGGSLAWD